MAGMNVSEDPMAKRTYQVWKGNNRFFLGGRVIFGPDVRSLFITILLILVPIVIFCVFIARHLRHQFPTYNAGYAILVVAIVYTFYVLVLLLLTSAQDPGIVPRALHPPIDVQHEYSNPNNTSVGQTPRPPFPRTREVQLPSGVVVKVKYCDTCMVYRPPRCSHCSICNNCVQRFDHHCPWVGQCVGLRNYRYFFMFVASSTLLCIYVFAMSALYIKFLMDGEYHTVWRALRHSPASVILMIYCFIAVWFVGGLTVFHLYLISTNQTTYENFRYRADGRQNPYDQGCVRNFADIFCTSIPPSKNNFRQIVEQRTEELDVEAMPHPGSEEEVFKDIRAKIEGDLELGAALSKVSERGSEIDDSVYNRSSNGRDSYDASGHFPLEMPSSHRHSSWGRKSESYEISSDVFAASSESGRYKVAS
ncbi:hypothetical protein AMTRI_Chr09g34600 [Amborella trichopoda]|uniref:S-acyltransferase n=1 Tax=Amborella trichopoda TaxID=13333 RepID=W1NL74_AMBTC|nr:protein S-acyltransferase 8 isoform X1 [Amborella trichopoda]XP_011628913.1 protein S-acyltransferase 8 isoform X1 [Amborella trichopoda]XP_020532319.1 protein S-acyltransferase 8 isoform X1 [Amborella trichopoda]ERM96216.1 hypothetical protein AMTR_s00001p00123260 [Amborella trichopoda]|eukprot:XP_006828800.1 protein S-acyltransferase 8 isoform X1 [Amborella trichopoda]